MFNNIKSGRYIVRDIIFSHLTFKKHDVENDKINCHKKNQSMVNKNGMPQLYYKCLLQCCDNAK